MTILLFPQQMAWTEQPCYYFAALHDQSYALLAGPYRTSAEAEAIRETARHWALHASGDPEAANYDYRAFPSHHGHSRSILGELRPITPAGLDRFNGYEIGPCQRFEEPDQPGRFYYQACEPEVAEVWTLYGRLPNGEVAAIGDFATLAHAAVVCTRITGEPYGR